MLIQELGFRPPRADEESRIRAKCSYLERGPAAPFLIPAAVLNHDPLISYSGIVPDAPLGLASIAGGQLRERTAWFLLSPTWSIEEDHVAAELRELAVLHRLGNRNHRIIFVCNAPGEVALLRRFGEAASLYNKTANTLESVFRPLDGSAAEFDAIYNAQLAPWKRHELSVEIGNCAFLSYWDRSRFDLADLQKAIVARHNAIPGHLFVNPFDREGLPIRLPPSEVNRHLNRASIGLCLSEREGAMFASTEYLLSGLPIVTTPSVGGRDVHFDEEYCWTVSPDPRSVADAVYALKAKGTPRAYIRDRTFGRLESDRKRFLGLLNAILEECGSVKRLAGAWPFGKEVTMQWHSPDVAVERAVYGLVDGFGKVKTGSLAGRIRRKLIRLRRRFTGG